MSERPPHRSALSSLVEHEDSGRDRLSNRAQPFLLGLAIIATAWTGLGYAGRWFQDDPSGYEAFVAALEEHRLEQIKLDIEEGGRPFRRSP